MVTKRYIKIQKQPVRVQLIVIVPRLSSFVPRPYYITEYRLIKLSDF